MFCWCDWIVFLVIDFYFYFWILCKVFVNRKLKIVYNFSEIGLGEEVGVINIMDIFNLIL